MKLVLKLNDKTEISVPGKESPLYENGQIYGPKLRTPYLAFWRNRWRRVYCANYGNVGTLYIGKPGAWEATVESVER